MLKKNDILKLEINDMTNLGFGVARHGGLVVFVSGAVSGDVVEAKIIKITSSYAVAKLERLIERSSHRCENRCTIGGCRSCAYKSVSYDYELTMKEGDVISAFKKAELPEIKIHPVCPSPTTVNYRNKAQYPITVSKNGDYIIGFYAPKSHNVSEAAACPLAPADFHPILEDLRVFFAKYKLSSYDESSGKGLLRHIYLRRGELSREIMLTLVINGDSFPHIDEFVTMLREKHADIKAFLLNINTDDTNVILGDKYINVFGEDYISDTLAGVKLKLTAPSFYQVNHAQAEALYAKARELADPSAEDSILDLYCGVGSIGLSMASGARELVGIEIVESAVNMARVNAADSGFTNAKFYTGDAKDTKKLLDNAERELEKKLMPTIIILDPPRAGCAPELIEFVSELAPQKIVYISCNPQTLARDIKLFRDHGYTAAEVFPYDMFPGTGHVEAICKLTRSTNHNMRLAPEPFSMIASGKKTIELRLNDPKRQAIKPGDTVTFTSTDDPDSRLQVRVTALHKFSSFKELYAALPLISCGYTEDDVAAAAPADMEKYYSREEEDLYGVVGIEIELLK